MADIAAVKADTGSVAPMKSPLAGLQRFFSAGLQIGHTSVSIDSERLLSDPFAGHFGDYATVNNSRHSSSARGDAVFVVKSVQDRASDNCGRPVESMPMALPVHRMLCRRIGYARPQGGVWSASVVVSHPQGQGFSQVAFGQGDDPVQTFPPQRPDQPSAKRSPAGCEPVS